MADIPKDDDAFEDADFEDLDPIEDDDLGDQSEEEPPDLDPISDSEASTDHDDPDSLPDDQDSGSEY